MTDSPSADILTMLSKQEESIAALYSAFAQALPKMKTFWSSLVIQEKAHGEVLREIGKLQESGKVYLNKSMFNAVAIQTNIDSMTKQIARVSAEGITAIRSLSLASDIEHSLIEEGYFKIIESDLPSVKQELEEIQQHTMQHTLMVDKQLQKLKTQQ
jgi:virulence-associated protein VapD